MNDEDVLIHYGVKGMKWGVRKERTTSPRQPGGRKTKRPKNAKPGYIVNQDGSIEIEKGFTLSRVQRNNKGLFGGVGVALESGAPIYAAFKSNDVAAYEHLFARGKSLFVKEASAILKLQAKTPLKAPGPKEAASLYYETLKENPKLVAQLKKDAFKYQEKDLDRAIANPTTKEAYEAYSLALDESNYNDKLKPINNLYYSKVQKAGYNMVVDVTDATAEFDAPVIVLDAKKSLQLKSQYYVDKASAENARLAFKSEQAKSGKTYLEELGYK